jgi:AcrR family transcriptional regulator
MTSQVTLPSARRTELLELAYQYAMQRGRTDLSLRPMAAAIGSSPRVLLYLFGSKDGLIRALLARARTDELSVLAELRQADWHVSWATPAQDPEAQQLGGLAEAAERIWSWLSDEARRPLLRLWLDGYARSLSEPNGPWTGFARATVDDWLSLLADLQPAPRRPTAVGLAERTLVLAVLRGALLDLLGTDDVARTTAAVRRQLAALGAG